MMIWAEGGCSPTLFLRPYLVSSWSGGGRADDNMDSADEVLVEQPG